MSGASDQVHQPPSTLQHTSPVDLQYQNYSNQQPNNPPTLQFINSLYLNEPIWVVHWTRSPNPFYSTTCESNGPSIPEPIWSTTCRSSNSPSYKPLYASTNRYGWCIGPGSANPFYSSTCNHIDIVPDVVRIVADKSDINIVVSDKH